MNVGTLKQLLEGYDDDVDVMIAHQPSWPLAEVVSEVVLDSERDVHDEDSDPYDEGGEPEPDCVWIVAGGHHYKRSPYAPRDVFESSRY